MHGPLNVKLAYFNIIILLLLKMAALAIVIP